MVALEAHVAAQVDPWAGTLVAACHTHREVVDHILAWVAAHQEAPPCAVAQASAHHGVAEVAPLALAVDRSHDVAQVAHAGAARNPEAVALQVAACVRMAAAHSPAEVDHSLGGVAAAAHVDQDDPMVVANEAGPSVLEAWKHPVGGCRSRNAVVVALLP